MSDEKLNQTQEKIMPDGGCDSIEQDKRVLAKIEAMGRGVQAILNLYNAPAHCNYDDDDCCGLFIEVVNGNLVCNECGIGILDLLEVIAKRPSVRITESDDMGLFIHVIKKDGNGAGMCLNGTVLENWARENIAPNSVTDKKEI